MGNWIRPSQSGACVIAGCRKKDPHRHVRNCVGAISRMGYQLASLRSTEKQLKSSEDTVISSGLSGAVLRTMFSGYISAESVAIDTELYSSHQAGFNL